MLSATELDRWDPGPYCPGPWSPVLSPQVPDPVFLVSSYTLPLDMQLQTHTKFCGMQKLTLFISLVPLNLKIVVGRLATVSATY